MTPMHFRFALRCAAAAWLRRLRLPFAVGLCLMVTGRVFAADSPRTFDVPADVAAKSLKVFSEQSGRGVVFSTDIVKDVRTNTARGSFTVREAIDRMLAGTSLVAVDDAGSTALAIQRAAGTPGAPSGTGMIEGRIFNPRTGEYLEFVRVTVEGTTLETFTDDIGQYRLTNVPAGQVTVRAFRMGVAGRSSTVTVQPGGVVQQDFTLTSGDAGQTGETVRLEQFVVSTSSEMDGAAIAINTQRFAPNSMNVVAADEFGPVANGNAGEVLKSVPGITLTLGGQGSMYQVSMNGVPPGNVPVTMGGFDLANADGTGRGAGLHLLSVNNASRIEVSYTPTPETTGSALAGTVNLVPRSAFERSKPIYNVSVAALMRDNVLQLGKTPGPRFEPQRKVRPEVMFSAVVPFKRFGFTVSASTSAVYTQQAFIQTTWRGAGAVTNGGTFPDTTPDQPYLTALAVRDHTSQPEREAFAATFDFKLTPDDIVTFSYQYGFFGVINSQRTLTFSMSRVLAGGFTPTSTRSAPGGGELQLTTLTTDVAEHMHMPSLTYRHNGPVWKLQAGAGFSRATKDVLSPSEGFFNQTQTRRQNVTIAFDDIFYLRPRSIAVTDTAGLPVDPYSIAGYSLNTANSNTLNTYSHQGNLYANARRDFRWKMPVTLKAGMDFRQVVRDIRQQNPSYTLTGAATNASQVLDESISQRIAPYGFPRIEFVDNRELYGFYLNNPGLFTTNSTTAYNSEVSASKYASEIISAAFLRGDLHLMSGRLKLVGGLRAEQTNARGEGQLVDLTRNYLRNAAGQVMLGANGRPQPITTDPLEAARLTRIDRGLKAEKEYLRLFPSLNATFNIREDLIARAGYYQSVGRPNLVQYAGSLTLPDTEEPPAPGNRISVNNAGIKAWTAHTFKAGLEYYWEPIGLLSVSGFHREIENFFGDTVLLPTPEFLALYGLNPDIYSGYEVSTEYNLEDKARMTGMDINYKQALTFLPDWARGVQVFGNMSLLRLQGPGAANFAGFIPKTANWGVGLTRPKYSVRMRWNYAGKARRGLVAQGRGIEPGTYNWSSKRLLVDLNGEYRLTQRFALFANLTNLGDAPVDLGIYGPSTPEHAQFRQRLSFGSIWTFGVKGTF